MARRSSATSRGGDRVTASPALHLRDGRTVVEDPAERIRWYDREILHGPAYYRLSPVTPPDRVTVEDLAYGVLLAGQPRARAAQSLAERPLDLTGVPRRPLAKLDERELDAVLDAVMELVARPGFGCALATKVLHKKRPATIPVIDNQAMFATYLDHSWLPGRSPWPTNASSVRDRRRIAEALSALQRDLLNPDNRSAWKALKAEFPALTRIELLDKVWWAVASPGAAPVRDRSRRTRAPGRRLTAVPTGR